MKEFCVGFVGMWILAIGLYSVMAVVVTVAWKMNWKPSVEVFTGMVTAFATILCAVVTVINRLGKP